MLATAQEEGKQVSETAESEFLMRPYYVMPQPVIIFTEYDGGVNITVTGRVAQMEVTVRVNDEIRYYQSDYDGTTITIESTYQEQLIEVYAINQGTTHGDIWTDATATYCLPALELPIPEAPEIQCEVLDDCVIVSAYSKQDDATVVLLKKYPGESEYFEVDNPCVIERLFDEEQVYHFTAYVIDSYGQQSEMSSYFVCVPMLEKPVTDTPSISGELVESGNGSNYMLVTVTPSGEEYVDIYYRYRFEDGEPSEWMLYYDQLCFSVPGHYRIEAYAIAENKEPSAMVCLEFILTEPVISQLYDFEEDGIFYKITSEGKVSVCSETVYHNSYSGEVNIPATVTHNGVTYMVTAIDKEAFSLCSALTSVTIGAYVTEIGDEAFYGCSSLTSVTLGDYVISLGDRAFTHCPALTTVNLGSGLAHIGAKAFEECHALTNVSCKAATPPVMASSDCFDSNVYATATLHVYPAVLDKYQAANYWKQFGSIVGEDKVAPAAGDINGDGKMSISDVTTLINMLLMEE